MAIGQPGLTGAVRAQIPARGTVVIYCMAGGGHAAEWPLGSLDPEQSEPGENKGLCAEEKGRKQHVEKHVSGYAEHPKAEAAGRPKQRDSGRHEMKEAHLTMGKFTTSGWLEMP